MKPNALLRIMSLLSIVLTTLHITDDYVRGLSRPGPNNVIAVAIFVVWLFGTLVLAERRSGSVIMLIGAVLAAAMPVLHMRGAGYPAIVKSSGGFFFVWTLLAVGVTGTFAVFLAVHALWSQRKPR
jgi:biotin transporter BioY